MLDGIACMVLTILLSKNTSSGCTSKDLVVSEVIIKERGSFVWWWLTTIMLISVGCIWTRRLTVGFNYSFIQAPKLF